MRYIKLNDDENLIVQPFIIGQLLLKLNEINFVNSKYFDENFDGSTHDTLKMMTLDSQGMVIMLLYSFLVIPYEKLKLELKSEYDNINNEIDNGITKQIFILKSNYSDKNYLKHIRNSIAHVRFKFIENTSLTFLDENINKTNHFELTIPLSKLIVILNRLECLTAAYFNNKQ